MEKTMSTSHIHSDVTPNTVTVVSTSQIPTEVREAADRLGVGQYFDEVAAFTIEVFGSYLSVELVPDPEVLDWEHIVFDVPVSGTAQAISDKQTDWCRRLAATILRAPRVFSIVMSYQE
jgi:hypothetical protein